MTKKELKLALNVAISNEKIATDAYKHYKYRCHFLKKENKLLKDANESVKENAAKLTKENKKLKDEIAALRLLLGIYKIANAMNKVGTSAKEASEALNEAAKKTKEMAEEITNQTEFKVGDRVLAKRNGSEKYWPGTIKKINYISSHTVFAVEFDEPFTGGHWCNGVCEPGRGLWCFSNYVKALDQCNPTESAKPSEKDEPTCQKSSRLDGLKEKLSKSYDICHELSVGCRDCPYCATDDCQDERHEDEQELEKLERKELIEKVLKSMSVCDDDEVWCDECPYEESDHCSKDRRDDIRKLLGAEEKTDG